MPCNSSKCLVSNASGHEQLHFRESVFTIGNKVLRMRRSMQIYPCSLSVTIFHLFQLTELSTIFLHLQWMLSKAQVPYAYLKSNMIALLATFVERVSVCVYIVVHNFLRLHQLQLHKVSCSFHSTALPTEALIPLSFIMPCTAAAFLCRLSLTDSHGSGKEGSC
jgi:hypothetical protein